MKTKNALMAKLWSVGSIRPLNYLGLILLLFVAIGIGSCRKEILVPKTSLPPSSNINLSTITYGDFLKDINVNSLGFLKRKLNYANTKNKLLSIADNNDFGNLAVYTDTVTRIINNGDTSFIFKMPLSSRRAVTFRNLTIQKGKGKTSAFIATYTPSREWIEARKQGRKMPFKGEHVFTELNLEGINLTQALSFDNSSGSNGKIMGVGNRKMLRETICSAYVIYNSVPYGCSNGNHMPWDQSCVWNTGDTPPEGQYSAGYTWEPQLVTSCYDIVTPDPPSGGGGGGTTPIPPDPYDPCNGGGDVPVAMNNHQSGKGLRLSLVPPPPTDCDDGPMPPLQPVYPYEVQSLIETFNLSGANLNYVVNNQGIALDLFNAYEAEEFSYEARIATEMAIKAGAAGVFDTFDDLAFYNAVSSSLPNSQIIDHTTLAIYFTVQCAIIRAEHPTWSKWKVGWEASKEIVHLTLDGIGLVPGAGEIADLANGLIYTIEGDGVNASLSYASAIPVAGWFAAGAKFAKKTVDLAGGTKTTLKWARKAGNLVDFGDRRQLRKVLNLLGDPRQAHHIIPWAKQTHPAIQKAAKKGGSNPFHMNDALNGIPLDNSVHLGSHSHYDNLVQSRLDQIPSNATPEQAYNKILDIISDIRTAVQNNPGVHINQLVF